MKVGIGLTALVLATLTCVGAASAQDVAAGEQSFKKCMPCHSIGEGAKNKVGPELNGLDGRHSGSAPGYSYSEANK
jgi:cytochrome c